MRHILLWRVRQVLVVITALFWASGLAAQVPSADFEKRAVTDKLGRTVTYYVSRPTKSAPILLMIQGSGCKPLIASSQGGSSLFNLIPYAKERLFTVVAVEKPYAGTNPGSSGTASDCSPQFNSDFTAESWLEALRASLSDAGRLGWVDGRRTLVLGMSEGAVMASLLAAGNHKITDVISIGGSGTTQLFDLLIQAHGCFDRSECISEIERRAIAIAGAPGSSTEFAWGHPYKRWSSFFKVDPSEELLRSRARIYLAFGTDDESVPWASQELIAAKLLSAQRDVTIRRVPDAGHSLVRKDSNDWSDLDRELRRALKWFWQYRK